jgi:hypothetical protein
MVFHDNGNEMDHLSQELCLLRMILNFFRKIWIPLGFIALQSVFMNKVWMDSFRSIIALEIC